MALIEWLGPPPHLHLRFPDHLINEIKLKVLKWVIDIHYPSNSKGQLRLSA